MKIVICILVFLFIVESANLTYLFLMYLEFLQLHKNAPKLKYKDIKQIYRANSKRIVFERKTYGFSSVYNAYIIDNFSRYVHFNTNFIDFISLVHKYEEYNNQKQKVYNAKSQAESLKTIINCVQSDIDKLKKESNKQINTARSETERIYRNLNKEK